MVTRPSVRGHAVSAAGAGALAVSLWLPWYSFRIPSTAIDAALQYARQFGALGQVVSANAAYLRQLGPLHVTAWQVYTWLPAVLLVSAAIGGGLALLSLTDRATGGAQLIAMAGVVGLGLILVKLVAPPLNGLLLHPAWGLFLGLGGSAAMLAGGVLARTDESRSLAEPDLLPLSSGAGWSTTRSVPPPASG